PGHPSNSPGASGDRAPPWVSSASCAARARTATLRARAGGTTRRTTARSTTTRSGRRSKRRSPTTRDTARGRTAWGSPPTGWTTRRSATSTSSAHPSPCHSRRTLFAQLLLEQREPLRENRVLVGQPRDHRRVLQQDEDRKSVV